MIFQRALGSHSQNRRVRAPETSTTLSTFWSRARAVVSLAIFVSAAIPLAAQALNTRSLHRCEFLFEAPPADRLPFVQRPHYPTVKIVGIERGERGEEFFRLRKLFPDYPWGSRYAIHSFDPQGDPSLIFHILGPDLAFVLGFRYDGDDIIAPTPETIDRRIARFNRFLDSIGVARIPVSFYSQRGAYKEMFLRHWYHFLGIPVAADLSTHTVHDISYHYSAVMLPLQMTSMLQAQAGIAWHWMRNPLARLLPLVTNESVRRVDQISVSGNVVPGEAGVAHFQFWSTVFADTLDPALKARPRSPLELFRERVVANNRSRGSTEERPLLENLSEKVNPFFDDLKKTFPEWNRKVEDFGLTDYASVRALYFERSADLRFAARKFREEMSP